MTDDLRIREAIAELRALEDEHAAARRDAEAAERRAQKACEAMNVLKHDPARFGLTPENPRRALNIGGRGFLLVRHSTSVDGYVELFDCGAFEAL